jgi:membrane protein required for colicin V production
MLGLNAFDVILAIMLIVSILGGFSKGFTTEVLKIVAWAGSIFLTIIALPISTNFMQDFIASEFAAKLVGMVVTFFVSFFFLKFLAKFVGDRIRTSLVAPLDRGLGALFGFARGALILSAVYLMYSNLVAEEDQPEWMMEARFQPYLSAGAKTLEVIAPDLFDRAEEVTEDALNADTDEILADMKDGMPTAGDVVDYTLEERDTLEDLIDEVSDEEDDEG